MAKTALLLVLKPRQMRMIDSFDLGWAQMCCRRSAKLCAEQSIRRAARTVHTKYGNVTYYLPIARSTDRLAFDTLLGFILEPQPLLIGLQSLELWIGDTENPKG